MAMAGQLVLEKTATVFAGRGDLPHPLIIFEPDAHRVKAELAALKSKIDRLNTAFTEGGLELQEFKELKNPLIVQKAVLELNVGRRGGPTRGCRWPEYPRVCRIGSA